MFPVSALCFAIALVLSLALTWVVRNRAIAAGVLAVPISLRHIHTSPVPRVGGVAIYLAITSTMALLFLATQLAHLPVHLRWEELWAIFLPATVIFLLGLYDDLRGVGPYGKFAVQTIAAVMVYLGGLRIVNLPILFGNYELGWAASLVITVFWILWITNAFNLIDGVDGLAAGSALFSTLVVFIASILNHNWMGLTVTAVLCGALLGFLRFNFNPATIFLGDSGSLLVGFVLGAVALHGQKSPTAVAVAIPVVSFGLPILETAMSVVRRFLNGKPIFGADCEHIHHKLLKRGLSQRQVALILYGASAVFGLLSLVLLLPGGGPVALVLIVLGGIVWLAVQHLGYHEFFELRRVAQRTIEQKQVIVNNLVIRRGAEELEACSSLEQLKATLLGIFEGNDFDGFELRYAQKDHFVRERSGFNFSWSRGELQAATWTLELDLEGADGKGSFSVHRYQSRRALMLDINLLSGQFLESLGRTLRRLAAQSPEEQLKPAGILEPHLAAQVGAARAHSIGTV